MGLVSKKYTLMLNFRHSLNGEEVEVRIIERLDGVTHKLVYQVSSETDGGVHIPQSPRLPGKHTTFR